MVNYLPSKQTIWVRFPLTAFAQLHHMSFKTVRSLGEVLWHHKKLTPRQRRFLASNTHKLFSSRYKTRQLSRKPSRSNTSPFQFTFASTFVLSGKDNKSTKRQKQKQSSAFFQKRKLSHFYGRLPALAPSRLEARLDVVLVRGQLCSTLRRARQWIQHGHICVNNRICVFSGYCLQPGDSISIAQHFQKQYHQLVSSVCRLKQVVLVKPSHLEINYKLLRILFLYEAKHVFFPYKIDIERAYSLIG